MGAVSLAVVLRLAFGGFAQLGPGSPRRPIIPCATARRPSTLLTVDYQRLATAYAWLTSELPRFARAGRSPPSDRIDCDPAGWCILTTGLWLRSVGSRSRAMSHSIVPAGDSVAEQLRDVAILATIALLVVLTLRVLWLTNPRRIADRRRRR